MSFEGCIDYLFKICYHPVDLLQQYKFLCIINLLRYFNITVDETNLKHIQIGDDQRAEKDYLNLSMSKAGII